MKPLVCVPMGDPAGIGPEIIVQSVAESGLTDNCRLIFTGTEDCLKRAANVCQVKLKLNLCQHVSEATDEKQTLNLFPVTCPPLSETPFGRVTSAAGETAWQCIKTATELALRGDVDALATTPINKESLKAAGIPHIGHTEILADLTHCPDPLTLFQVKTLRVFFFSRHLSLREACDYITETRLVEFSRKAIKALQQLGIEKPHLAIAALNPHGGEQGLFGDEEMMSIKPAIRQLQQEGFQISGPLPADSVFHQVLQGRYDAVISLYHDQGHIATKMVDFEKTISITCGLPFLRTSVDHGTAFDIAGQGIASSVSLVEAISLAAKYAGRMKRLC
ncbi:4-hydroxythreonine-4-phosphate dehydrogenase PdxA [Endozoicomonas gorgoniicola]|uniref:4-hydroxythreonine-4-phosphate dehydrogenase PdxA n=1 Tax=Endozoicomonas gorgoniicola TaxID=1234144 RepID=A0ABT3N1T8_9GAMM|nr:4-hydroxythreonine-4-phosphate dehydrogenase PdxA [Endozoicomonas gorgoniicola]MCW7555596.1 4-hydroxythreonine-4-phosphate dehydrogenase PdxA [Endozoicomonas gorgoniicola]